jgi:hypothetical protein
MAITEERAVKVREELHGRIAAIAGNRGSMNPRQLVEGIDEIRIVAQNHGFSTVACIAGQLESALAGDSGRATLLCYLDALDDAVRLDPTRVPAQTQALLASIALRLGQ